MAHEDAIAIGPRTQQIVQFVGGQALKGGTSSSLDQANDAVRKIAKASMLGVVLLCHI